MHDCAQSCTKPADLQTGMFFLTPAEKREFQGLSVKDMQAKIGQLAVENEWKGCSASSQAARCEDRRIVPLNIAKEPNHEQSVWSAVTLGIDLAKRIFALHGADVTG